jgi:hypothetical protein
MNDSSTFSLTTTKSTGLAHAVFMGGNSSVWSLICTLTDALDQEVQQEPGKSFELSKEDLNKMHYPGIKTLAKTARYIKDFRQVFELYGQAAGYLPMPEHPHSIYSVYKTLYYGENAVNTLIKTLNLAKLYYKRNTTTAVVQPAEEMITAIASLWEAFDANKIFAAEMFPDEQEPIGLTYLANDLYALQERIMNMDQGNVLYAHRNMNGKITFFQNGAVKVELDYQIGNNDEKYDHNNEMWSNYHKAMHAADIMTNSGSFSSSFRPNQYTIPGGADLELVLQGLVNATFITEQEKESLMQRLMPKRIS